MVENEDGTLDPTLHLAVTPELVRWIQSWGADVQVLAPVSLDDQILAEARRHLEKAALRRSLTSDLSK